MSGTSEPGKDLVVPPAPGVRRGLVIPASELVERFSRSSGPGGQGVNTTDSRVELLFDVAASVAFTDEQRARILDEISARFPGGRISLVGSEQRSQLRNREAVRARLVTLLHSALAPAPAARRATKPTRGSQFRRLDAKKRRSDIKTSRGRPSPTD